jgi:hypothetical protein
MACRIKGAVGVGRGPQAPAAREAAAVLLDVLLAGAQAHSGRAAMVVAAELTGRGAAAGTTAAVAVVKPAPAPAATTTLVVEAVAVGRATRARRS